LHETQGFDYAFPDLCNPLFLSKLVVEDDAGRAVMASLARLTCEIYLLMDPAAGTPRDRFARIAALQRSGESDLRTRGLEDAHAWLPPRIPEGSGAALPNLAGSAMTHGPPIADDSPLNSAGQKLYNYRDRARRHSWQR
jgi:hypothetical protein